MYKLLFYLFTGYAFVNVYIQTAELPCRQFTTPIMTGSVGILALIGLLSKKLNKHEGIFLTAAWLLAATGDIFFEKSRLATNADVAGQGIHVGCGCIFTGLSHLLANFTRFRIQSQTAKMGIYRRRCHCRHHGCDRLSILAGACRPEYARATLYHSGSNIAVRWSAQFVSQALHLCNHRDSTFLLRLVGRYALLWQSGSCSCICQYTYIDLHSGNLLHSHVGKY